jgi:hypothetical protein
MKIKFISILLFLGCFTQSQAQKSILHLQQLTLMNEVRSTPSPLDGEHLTMNPPRFMWPDKYPHLGAILDGIDEKDFKPEVTYRIRISQDRNFKKDVIKAERHWAFFNPFKIFIPGTWYWQTAFVRKDGTEEWSPIYHFIIDSHCPTFNPPSFKQVLNQLPKSHPCILLDGKEWNDVISRNQNNPEAQAFLTKANGAMKTTLGHLNDEIDVSHVKTLTDKVQYNSALIRESRKVVDREEANIESMIRAYLLTKNTSYYTAAMKRLTEVLSWKDNEYFAGDFNMGTILSMSTSAYDAFYNILTSQEKRMLLQSIQTVGTHFYRNYVNHLENRIADNHVWQMTFRILSMAAFATVGELPEASVWADYCYNEWVSRFPGLNDDGAWHNGDSYFQVNIRTLVEVPALYSRITGFNYFNDPWYNKNALYVIYHQPPFSMSAGHGNSHEDMVSPNASRVGYADALARECQNPYAAAYVKEILKVNPDILKKGLMGKAGDLTWYRCITHKRLPVSTLTLADLPDCKVFNETGVATMHTALDDYKHNAMLSFRSSPYGSTSHALANQNSFNTFYGGKAIFYSSGHRTGFTDDHCMYAYRNTRAHNAILVNGMTQTIGTEGYGWIPRWYEGEKLSYFVGDASNAYGEVVSPLWLSRAKESGTHFTPEKGWDKNKLNFFRRHVIQLGNSGLFVIYDELKGKEAVTWSYLLHTTELPMDIQQLQEKEVTVTGKNKSGGISIAHLFCSEKMQTAQTDTFFCPATEWKEKSTANRYPNHWHFTAKTPSCMQVRFLTIIDTHAEGTPNAVVRYENGKITVGDWFVDCNLSNQGSAYIQIKNTKENVSLQYHPNQAEGKTLITDQVKGKTVKKELTDIFPRLEI